MRPPCSVDLTARPARLPSAPTGIQSLDRLITEATALTDTDKATLIGTIFDSMTDPAELEAFDRQVQIARDRLVELESGQVQTISGDIALAEICKLLES